MISTRNGLNDDELGKIIEKRCQKIRGKFNQSLISQVSDSKLLTALREVSDYWRDLSRPALTVFSCEAVGGDPEMAENAAVMFALASSGFGVHDDILDRSSNKHLRMTILGLHGADSALLVGDLLIVKGWAMVSEIIKQIGNPSKVAELIEAYRNLSVEICEAELMEIECRRKVDTDLEYYKNILWKEMAETEACSKIGAMIGDGASSEVKALSEFGRRIGFMSRLADDVEDCLNLKGDLPHRIEFESVPLPLLYAARFSSEKHIRIKGIVEKNSITPSDTKLLLSFCFETEAFEYVRNLGRKNEEQALGLLTFLKPSTARNVLSQMIEKSYRRIASLCV